MAEIRDSESASEAAREEARRRAEEARRRAEEAQRRAEEQARRLAELRAREEQFERMEQLTAANGTNTFVEEPEPPVEIYGGATASGETQYLPPVAPEFVPEDDVLVVTPPVDPEVLEATAEANLLAQQAWASLPPDVAQVVFARQQLLRESGVEAWTEAMQGLVGPGDQAAFDRYLAQNQETLELLETVLLGGQDITSAELLEHPELTEAYVAQLYAPALTALQAEHPDATFRLLAVETGTLPERPAGDLGIVESPLVIEMVENGQASYFGLNTDHLLMTQWLDGPVPEALTANPEVLEGWYQAVVDNGIIPPEADQGTALDTLNMVTEYGAQGAVVDGILAMPPELQAQFFQELGTTPLLVPLDNINAQNVIVSASTASMFDPTAPVDAMVNVQSVDGLDKMQNFVEQNREVLVDQAFQSYLALRGDEGRLLAGTDLYNEVGAALQLPPNNIPYTDEEWAAFAAGEWSLYTDPQTAQDRVEARAEYLETRITALNTALSQAPSYAQPTIQADLDALQAEYLALGQQLVAGNSYETITTITAAIESVGSPVNVTAMPVVFTSPEAGMVQLPLFRVESPTGQTVFVDNLGREYSSIEDWRDNNKLPAGTVTYPADGHLTAGPDGEALTVTESTVSTREQITQILDTAALVGGVVLGAAVIIGTGGAAIPLVGAGLSLYGAGRAGMDLYDMASHGQSINPFESTQARNAWVNMGANALGFAALTSAPIARALLQNGSRYAGLAVNTAVALNLGAAGGDLVAMGDLALTVGQNWENMTPQQLATVVLQAGFWGGMQMAQIRQAGGLANLYSADAIRTQIVGQAAMAGLTDPGFSEGTFLYHALTERMGMSVDPAQLPALQARWDSIEVRYAELQALRASAEPGTPLYEAFQQADAMLAQYRMAASGTIRGEHGALVGTSGADIGSANFAAADAQMQAWLAAGEPLTMDMILELNRLYGTGLAHNGLEPGALRGPGQDVYAGGVIARGYVPGEDVPTAMNDFMNWYNYASQTGMPPEQLAAVAFQRLISIHPFGDANGRTCRAVMDYILQSNGLPPVAFQNGGPTPQWGMLPVSDTATPTQAVDTVTGGLEYTLNIYNYYVQQALVAPTGTH